jgi:hypothetical protein
MLFEACVLLGALYADSPSVIWLVLALSFFPAFVLMLVCCTLALLSSSCGDVEDVEEEPATKASIASRDVAMGSADPQDCPICLVSADAPVSLVCGHAFHEACITRWLVVSPTCPTCRADPLTLSPRMWRRIH